MTIRDAIELADEMKPNAFSNKVKLFWINALEGRVAADVFLMAPAEIAALHYTEEDMETELLVLPPHDDIYPLWLQARIDEANGEYNKYANSMQIYNEHYGVFVRWFASTYEPAQGYPDTDVCAGSCDHFPYYITAYGLAVKQGFTGTLDEWLASLDGEQGESVELRYEQESQTLQWKYTGGENWQELLNVEDLRSAVVSETLESARTAASAAQVAQEAAEAAEKNGQAAREAAEMAADEATAIGEEVAQTAQGADEARLAAERARDAAENARDQAESEQSTATTQAEAAEKSASAADKSRTDAETAASSAKVSQTAAEESAAAAKASESASAGNASAADKSREAAEKAAESAQASEMSAAQSAEKAEDALGKGPYIDDSTKTWFVWDTASGQFIDTGIRGEAIGATVSASGLWGVEVDENGDLNLLYVGDDPPPLSLEDGNLIYTLNGNKIVIGNVGTGGGGSGQTPNITIGQVDTLPAGSEVTATITGETPNLVLNLGIPQGPAGDGVPPTDGVPEDYVLTPAGWAELSPLENEWTLIDKITISEKTNHLIFNNNEYSEFMIFIGLMSNVTSNYWKRLFMADTGAASISTDTLLFEDYVGYQVNKVTSIHVHPIGDKFYQAEYGTIDGDYQNPLAQSSELVKVKQKPYIQFYNGGSFNPGDTFEIWGR